MAAVDDSSAPIADTSALVTSAEPPCPLLDKLPPELRNEIYAVAFADNNCAGAAIDLLKANPPSDAKALIGTCRQINSEARNLYNKAYQAYWTSNKFQIRHMVDGPLKETKAKLDLVSEEDLRRINRLEFYQERNLGFGDAFCQHTYRLVDARGAWLCVGKPGLPDIYRVIRTDGHSLLLHSKEQLAIYLESVEEMPSVRQQIEGLLWRNPK